MFTHGGLITSYLYDLEQFEMPPNGSFIGVHLKGDGSGQPEDIEFKWDFPYIEEDI